MRKKVAEKLTLPDQTTSMLTPSNLTNWANPMLTSKTLVLKFGNAEQQTDQSLTTAAHLMNEFQP